MSVILKSRAQSVIKFGDEYPVTLKIAKGECIVTMLAQFSPEVASLLNKANQVEKLEQENRELKEWQKGVYALSCYLVFHESNNDIVMGDAKAALAQHDREVAVKVIEDFVFPTAFRKMWSGDEVVKMLNEYKEKLKKGE